MRENKPTYKKYYPVIKWLLALASVVYFAVQWRNADAELITEQVLGKLLMQPLLSLTVIALMLLNWSLEATKFRVLISPEMKLSRFNAIKIIFAGVTVSTFTPARTGEYIGRSVLLKALNPIKVIVATVTGNITQVLFTYIVGLLAFTALVLFSSWNPMLNDFNTGLIYAALIAILLILILYYSKTILAWLKTVLPKSLLNGLRIIKHYKRPLILQVLGLSGLRYFTFTLQFFILLYICSGNTLSLSAFALIPIGYMMQSIIPVAAISDIGLRIGVTGLLFGDLLTSDQIFAAVTSIWFINIISPAILGAFVLLFSGISKR